MKKIAVLLLAATFLNGCYESYVKDYEYNSVYTPYQFDLRTFVVGEGMKFEFGTVLGGVINNKSDRDVSYVIDDDLVTADLSSFGYEQSFKAIDVFRSTTTQDVVSSPYVTAAFSKAGVRELRPLPHDCYSLSPQGKMTINSGKHTAGVTVRADSSSFFSLVGEQNVPCYALAYKIVSADADTVLLSKSYEVIAVRYDCMFFGSWYHGGKSVVVDDALNKEIAGSEIKYPTVIPCDDATPSLYTLSTVAPDCVSTNYICNKPGKLLLKVSGTRIEVSSSDVSVTDTGSSWNGTQLLQGRKLFLNYKYSNGDGTSTVVTDTLSFRNRTRDGVNEWQDSNIDHYK